MSTQENSLGVAVIGLGVGWQHALAYLADGRCRLRWVYDLDNNRAQDWVNSYQAGAVANSFEQILHDPLTHAVSIASFDDAHYQQVIAALEAGKHVFVEKPLCRTLNELRLIKQGWSKHGGKLKLSSNLVLRAAPVYRWLKRKIERGELGGLYAFDGDYLYGRLHKITGGWRKDVKNYSVIEGGGIHLIDLMLWLTGERPSFLSAMGNRICTKGSDFQYNDFVSVSLQSPSGLVSRVTANFGCVHRHQHVVRIFGTKETFIYDDMGPRLHLSRDPSVAASAIELSTLPETKGDLIAPFISAILDDENLDAHTQNIFDAISVCVASEEALQSESTVKVQYL
jgi:predicted dehydrogenase